MHFIIHIILVSLFVHVQLKNETYPLSMNFYVILLSNYPYNRRRPRHVVVNQKKKRSSLSLLFVTDT